MSEGSVPRSFIDTNVFVYTDDKANPAKQARALEVLDDHKRTNSGVVSLQVLQEYFVTVTRKYGLDPGAARRKVELFAVFDMVAPVSTDVLAAIDLHRLHNLSYWDSLVLHCARRAGCQQALSEDMHHGQVIDGVRIVNPFV